MSFLKDIGSKAKEAATVVGAKSQDMVEVGKIRMKISNLEGDIKKLKTEIGERMYTSYTLEEEVSKEQIEKIYADIDTKSQEIQELKENIEKV